jgi:hypothetical protein
MAAIPAYVKTWTQLLTTGTPGQRITFSSVTQVMGQCAVDIKAFLLASSGSISVLWTCDGTTGPTSSSDHTDRVTTQANFAVQTAAGATATSYYVLTDGNGGQLLVAYTSATAALDQARISYSPTGSYVLAGTSTHIPTAADELVISNNVTIVGTTTSADRILHGLCTSDGKNYRFGIWRTAALIGPAWGVETFSLDSSVAATVSPVVTAWVMDAATLIAPNVSSMYNAVSASAHQALVRAVVSSVQKLCTAVYQTIVVGGNAGPTGSTNQPELQGTAGFIPWPTFIYSTLATATGPLGTLIDFWVAAPVGFAIGDGFGGTYEWFQMGALLWPNPSIVAPTLA